jgi:hypothetical protein
MLHCFRAYWIGLIFKQHKTGTREPEGSGGCAKPQATIAEAVEINAALDLTLGFEIDVFDL